jgi:hypothetical protein
MWRLRERRGDRPGFEVTPSPHASPRRPWRRIRWINDHPVVFFLMFVVIPVLALTVSVLDLMSNSSPQKPDESSAPAMTPPASSTGASPDAAQSKDMAEMQIGICLNKSYEATPCDAPHAFEVVSRGESCPEDEVLAYLGGSPGQDVLRPDLTFQPGAPGTEAACILQLPAGAEGMTAKDVLLGDQDDLWRRCLDELARDVPCAESHRAEWVSDGVEPGEAVDCTGRADVYLKTPFAQLSDDLELLQQGDGCLLSVRGDNLLTASLRRLGSAALPMIAN